MENVLNISFDKGYVLAVEDSKVQAKRIRHFFDENNIPAKICSNGAEALEAAKQNKPLIIISDVVMPVMDGYEFCSNIKSDHELADIPVILLTSLSDPLDIIKGLQAGADNFITKPYEEDYLLTRMKYLIANRHFRQMGSGEMAIEIVFQSQKFRINSDKKQILNLLLSVYEAAISRNEQLIHAQQQLELMNENLQAANKELEAFSHTVSHDLKSPLNGVIGFAELLKSMYGDVLDDEAKSYLNNMIKSAYNMAQLIEDLLNFSKSSRAKINPEVFDLSEMVQSVVRDLRESTYKTDYQVHVEKDIIARADPGLIRIVLNNLVSNALKYSQNKEKPEIHFGTMEKDGEKVLYLRDNGVGFNMSKADDLFRPFIRLHTSHEFQGTGVGLSTVKRIIEKHGGDIWFESTPGEGTCFYFTIE
jgi:two-component system, sensor histidine kinase and response regulator